MMNLDKLAEPFPANEIEWRIGRCGEKNGKIWGTAFCYVDARAVTHRFDEACGVTGWRIEKPEPLISENKIVGFMVGISVKVGDEWIAKWDVADTTDFEAIKGGMSGAVRRTAAVWGVGKYLYKLEEGFIETSTDKQQGWNYQPANTQKGVPAFYWRPPALPDWALPGGSNQAPTPPPKAAAPVNPPAQGSVPLCPKHGTPMKERTRKSDGHKFWGCTKKDGDQWCGETVDGEKPKPPTAPPKAVTCREYDQLSQLFHDIGCKSGHEAQAVLSHMKPGLQLEACKKNSADCKAAIDAIDAACTLQGRTFAEIYADAMGAVDK